MTKGLLVSFLVHFLILAIVILSATFVRTVPKIDLTQAVRVDMVGLPDKAAETLPEKLTEPQSKPAEMPSKTEPDKAQKPDTPKVIPPKEVPKKETQDIALKKSKERQQEALRKLKRQSAIESIKDELNKERAKLEATSKPIKGEVLSPGSKPSGLAKIEYDLFLAQIDSSIKNNWTLPGWLLNKPLQARLKVRIDPFGRLLSTEIIKSSGNPTYDEFCVQAIGKSVPFPSVPERFVEIFKTDGFVIGFPD